MQPESARQLKPKRLSLRWDNAPVPAWVNVVERFLGTLKQELVHRRGFAPGDVARREVFEYLT